ncbi:glycosyl hydrolase [Bacteroidota bacterium]
MQSQKKFIKVLFSISLLFCFLACSDEVAMESVAEKECQIGFNMRWRDTPPLSNNLTNAISGMKPDLLRYPGGTLAHKWNWKTGLPTPNNSNDVVHPISDVKKMAEATQTEVMFVVDIVNSSIANQIEMLKASNVSVNYVEIGNELYSDHYENIFPSGKSYADTINSWVPELKKHFPHAKYGVCMIGRAAGNDRRNAWNHEVSQNIEVSIDAYIYHIYVSENETVTDRIERFEQRFVKNSGKETWITEFGAHSHTLEQTNEISNYVESIADIALNHCLISASGNFSKIDDQSVYTLEGLLFVDRNKNK